MVITPEHRVVDTSSSGVVIPAHDGQLGVLPQRAPLMCELGVGTLTYQADGTTHRLFIDGGFAQVHDDLVTVLTPNARAASEITADDITAAQDAARESLTAEFDPDERERRRRREQTLRALRP